MLTTHAVQAVRNRADVRWRIDDQCARQLGVRLPIAPVRWVGWTRMTVWRPFGCSVSTSNTSPSTVSACGSVVFGAGLSTPDFTG